jgi:hypothetical protein
VLKHGKLKILFIQLLGAQFGKFVHLHFLGKFLEYFILIVFISLIKSTLFFKISSNKVGVILPTDICDEEIVHSTTQYVTTGFTISQKNGNLLIMVLIF